MKGNHGFTLVEIMNVVVIIGIPASIAKPSFVDMQERPNERSCL